MPAKLVRVLRNRGISSTGRTDQGPTRFGCLVALRDGRGVPEELVRRGAARSLDRTGDDDQRACGERVGCFLRPDDREKIVKRFTPTGRVGIVSGVRGIDGGESAFRKSKPCKSKHPEVKRWQLLDLRAFVGGARSRVSLI